MGVKLTEPAHIKPVKILVVSQEYDGYDNLSGIKKNVKELDSIYARLLRNEGDNFRKRFLIEYFFDRSHNLGDLQADVISGKYDIVHFSLHGDEKVILFSESIQIPYSKFESLFSIKSNIRVVILNICESDEMACEIAENIDWVLGWPGKVIVDDATEATNLFYSSLFAGNSIEDSFRCITRKKGIKPVIYKNSVLMDKQEPVIRSDSGKVSDSEPEKMSAERVSGPKRLRKKLLIVLISLGLIISILIVPLSKILNHGNTYESSAYSDNLQITNPLSGSSVERETTVTVKAKLRSEGKPWIFVLPPGGSEWWPQRGGTLKGEEWEFPVIFGNEIDSGKFRVLALIIRENIAIDMQEWLRFRGTERQSNPLSDELIKSFFWYGADSAVYYRIRR